MAKDAAVLAAIVAWAYVALLTPTLLMLRLVPPRPPRARLMSLAGASACVALALALLYDVACWAVVFGVPSVLADGGGYDAEDLRILIARDFLYQPWGGGLVVAAAWTPQVLGGRLRAEPTWIDRAGRFLGCYALACVPLSWVLEY